MPDGSWPSPVGAGGGTTPAFGHPSRPPRPSGTPPKEGNGGECAGFVSVCGKTVHPSPATLASSLVSAWRGRGDVPTSPATTPDPSDAPPASRSTCKPLHLQAAPPASRSARKSPRLQADPTKDPNHHALSESNAPSLPPTVPVPRHSPPLRRGGRRPGWSARDGRQAVADTSRTSSAVRPTISATRSGSKPLASMLRTIWRFSSSRPCSMPI